MYIHVHAAMSGFQASRISVELKYTPHGGCVLIRGFICGHSFQRNIPLVSDAFLFLTTYTLISPLDLLPREQFSYLKGKALNVLPEHSPEAERLLASAIKRDPSLADAWVSLGECYWKKGNVQQAHDCFTSSINHVT